MKHPSDTLHFLRRHARNFFFTAATLFAFTLCAAPSVDVRADRTDITYECGRDATFTITIKGEDGKNLKSGIVTASLDNFGPCEIMAAQPFDLAQANPFKVKGTLREPGFLRLSLRSDIKDFPKTEYASGVYYTSVGFEPSKLTPARDCPKDFDAFWANGRAEIAKVPADFKIEKSAKFTNAKYDAWLVSFATVANRRMYGWLTKPKGAQGKLPARLQIAAAGFGGWSQGPVWVPGHITLFMTVYPFEPNADTQRPAFNKLNEDAQKNWQVPRYAQAGIGSDDARDSFFYPVLLGVDRAVEWLAARDDVDTRDFTYAGTSQGGGLGFFIVGLNKRFTRAAFFVPALTDHYGYEKGHLDGWPHFVREQTNSLARLRAAERNAAYYDGINFARRITTPSIVICGTSDAACYPTCVWTAYNVIPAAEKHILTGFGMTHSVWGTYYAAGERWLKGEDLQKGDFWRGAETLREGVLLRSFDVFEPRHMRCFMARIDLKTKGIHFTATDRAEGWGEPMPDYPKSRIRTKRETTVDFMTRKRAEGKNVCVAVNTAPWGPFCPPWNHKYANPGCWIVSDGVEVCQDGHGRGALFVVRKDGRCEITGCVPPAETNDVLFATCGFSIIATNGVKRCKYNPNGLAPRTAFGLSADKRYLYLLALDGRQKDYSLGSDTCDLCDLLFAAGASDAINMDGGGSTSLVYFDEKTKKPVMVNHQGGGARRSVAVNFGICFD